MEVSVKAQFITVCFDAKVLSGLQIDTRTILLILPIRIVAMHGALMLSHRHRLIRAKATQCPLLIGGFANYTLRCGTIAANANAILGKVGDVFAPFCVCKSSHYFLKVLEKCRLHFVCVLK